MENVPPFSLRLTNPRVESLYDFNKPRVSTKLAGSLQLVTCRRAAIPYITGRVFSVSVSGLLLGEAAPLRAPGAYGSFVSEPPVPGNEANTSVCERMP